MESRRGETSWGLQGGNREFLWVEGGQLPGRFLSMPVFHAALTGLFINNYLIGQEVGSAERHFLHLPGLDKPKSHSRATARAETSAQGPLQDRLPT